MIVSIKHKGLRSFFEKGNASKIQASHRKRLKLVMTLLHAANDISDLNFPGSNLHRLKGEFDGYWSLSIGGNWRVIFRFENGDVINVDYLDYH